jgi:hypothetical protein
MTVNEVISALRDMDGEAELFVMLPSTTGFLHFTSVEMTEVLETDEERIIYCIIPHEPENTPIFINYN